MKIIKNSKDGWIKGKGEMAYQKRILMNNIPPSVNLIEDIIIPAGGKIPTHAHKQTAEIFYITKGRIWMKIGEKEFELSEKDIVFIDVDEEHSFRNGSNENLEMIVLKINFKKDDAILYTESENHEGKDD
jgi:mannose-6-phosphate isomerase-like protein (cupin superfamily)